MHAHEPRASGANILNIWMEGEGGDSVVEEEEEGT